MALVSLRDALARGAVPPPTAPAPAPQPTPAPSRSGPTSTGSALSTTGSLLSAYNSLGRMFPGLNLGQIPYANWMSALLNIGAGAANNGVQGAGRAAVGALPRLALSGATSPLASAMGSGAGYANLGLAGANFAAGLSGNQTAQGLMNTLGTSAAYAFNPASALGMFAGSFLENAFKPAKTREQVFAELMDSVPAFGPPSANRLGQAQEHSAGATPNIGALSGLRGMRSSGVINGVDTNAAWNYARAWTLADVMANPYGTMNPNRYGESHEWGYGPNRQLPTRDPRVLGQMLDDEVDLFDTNAGPQMGEGANSGISPLVYLASYVGGDSSQADRIRRQGTIMDPRVNGVPFEVPDYSYNLNTV